MGNIKSTEQPLALIAVARQLKLQRCQIVTLRDSLSSFADADGYIDKITFLTSLTKAKILETADVEIFELLFIMWDSTGIEKIPYMDFAVGVAALACPNDDVVSILRFAMHIQDEASSGMISSRSLLSLLHWIHATASYFGDAQLEAGDIAAIVESVFDSQTSLLTHTVCSRRLQCNAYIKRFLSGKTRSRVQFKEDLTLVTTLGEEFELVEKNSSVTSPDAVQSLMQEHMWAFDQCMSPGGGLSALLNDSRDSWDSFMTDDSPSTGSFSKRTKQTSDRHKRCAQRHTCSE